MRLDRFKEKIKFTKKKRFKMFCSSIVLTCMLTNSVVNVVAAETSKQDNVTLIENFNLDNVSRVFTGTNGFDGDDNPGNDSGPNNNIVRSFDTIGYEMTYSGETSTDVNDVEIEFELSLNVSKKYAEFDISILEGWMIDIVQEDVGGKCVLKGKTIYKSGNAGNLQSFSEIKSIFVNVKGMRQGEDIIPTFKVKDSSAKAWKEKVMSSDSEKAIVSATPMFDIELTHIGKVGALGTYDFATGTSVAPNKGAGDVYGRLMDFAAAIRLKSFDSNKGMKGFYVPENDVDITFTLDTNIKENGVDISTKPLLWDYKNNNRSKIGQARRDLTGDGHTKTPYSASLPLTDVNDSKKDYSVNNGGKLGMTQNADGTISVTVSGASLYDNKGNLHAPTLKGDGGAKLSPSPAQGNIYLSTMFFELVVPIDSEGNTSESYELVVSDKDMNVPYKDAAGNDLVVTNDDQTVKTNDSVRVSYDTLINEGKYGLFHYYVKEDQQNRFWADNLSSNKAGMGLDAYRLQGEKAQVVGAFSYDGDNIKENVNAINLLMRIDNRAMQPSAEASNGVPTSKYIESDIKLLYAAKPGGSGWESDAEMQATNEDELEYFESMTDLKNKYPNGVCVAVLAEMRNVTSMGAIDQYTVGFNVDIYDDAAIDTVYQTVHTATFYNESKKLTVEDSRLNNSSILNNYSHRVRDENSYVKAEYNNSNQIINGSNQNTNFIYGASLLVVGVEAGVEKTITTGESSFDLSSGIKYIPYKIQPVLNIAQGKEGSIISEVKITDVLPDKLKISKDTKFYYGDEEITPTTIEKQGDGTTKIVWTIENVKATMKLPSITFNAEIDIDNIDFDIVKHEIENKAYIEATGDNRVLSSKWTNNPNLDTANVVLVVNKSLNLSKQVEKPLVEINNEVKYKISFTNTNNSDYKNYKMLDVLPYNGDDRGSKFEGTYGVNARLTELSSMDLYITTDLGVRGKDVETFNEGVFVKVDPIREEDGYKYYELGSDVTAIMLQGVAQSKTSYVLDITLLPENNNSTDIYANLASMRADGLNKLTSSITKAEVIERKLSGVAWIDSNKNGLIDSAEAWLSGLTVRLQHTDPISGVEAIAKDIYGNECVTITDSTGYYEFNALVSGDYRIEFIDKDGNPVNLVNYTITEKLVGSDDSKNSKAETNLSNSGGVVSAQITNIKLPTLEEMKENDIRKYEKKYQNIGIYLETANKTVTKVWDDNSNQDGIRPESIEVQLLANGTAYGDVVVLNEANDWKYTWSSLPLNEAGKVIDYTVGEITVPNGYEVSYVDDGAGNDFTITNKHVPGTVEKAVTKVWDDNNNQDGIRPESIEVQLLADGAAYGDVVVLDEANDWKYTWDNLPLNKAGKVIDYTVEEKVVRDGYEVSYLDDREGNDFTITNKHVPSTINKIVTKIWDDNNNQDGIRPESIEVQLLADGAAYGDVVVLNEANDWKYTWSNLPLNESGKIIDYTVEEKVVIDGYEVSYLDDGAGNDFTITNKHVPGTVEKAVTKIWDDNNNQDGIRPGSIEVQLLANGTAYGDVVVLDEANDWKYTWSNLPLNKAGKVIDYTVEEKVVIDGYEVSYVDDGAENDFTITNKHVPSTVNKTVTKIWDDNNNQDGIRPESIEVQLLANGTAYGDVVVLNEANDWKYIWSNLPLNESGEVIDYTVEEKVVIDGYEVSYVDDGAGDDFIITNKHVPDKLEEVVTGDNNHKEPNSILPQTGDTTNFKFLVFILILAGSILLFLYRKKNKA